MKASQKSRANWYGIRSIKYGDAQYISGKLNLIVKKKGTAFAVQKIKKTGQRGLEPCALFELSEYLDYGPADSGSSVADSDSEPDSEDGAFIEHDEPLFPGQVIC